MRSFRESGPGQQKSPEEGKATVAEKKMPSMYRIVIAAFVVVLCFVICILVTSRSGSYTPEGGRIPRVVVIAMENIDQEIVSEAMASNKAPGLQALSELGLFAPCVNGELCATTPSSYSVAALTSILTGVTPAKHAVMNDTAISQLYRTANKYPTFLQAGVKMQLRPTIIASEKLFSGSTVDTQNGQCSPLGLLDVECSGVYCPSRSEVQCNRQRKVVYQSAASGAEEAIWRNFSSIVSEEGTELIFIHMNSFTEAMKQTATASPMARKLRAYSQLYLIDSVVGRISAFIQDRTLGLTENWAIAVVSEKGPWFFSAFSAGKPIALRPLQHPVSVMDFFPTVLYWLGVVDLSSPTVKQVDGNIQGLCGNGVLPPEICQ